GNDDINVQAISLEPSVITLPGRITLGIFAGKIQRPFDNIDELKIELVRKTSYPDLCNLLDRMEREDWVGISARIAAEIRQLIASVDSEGMRACPRRPNWRSLTGPCDLPGIPSLLAAIANGGDYKIRVELSNSRSGSLMSCFEMEMTLKKGLI
uniref:Transcriptional regulator n=1 Tax=Macrostomum lignano TaxID=282301 RepID=A0A1I8FNY5_9PLAT